MKKVTSQLLTELSSIFQSSELSFDKKFLLISKIFKKISNSILGIEITIAERKYQSDEFVRTDFFKLFKIQASNIVLGDVVLFFKDDMEHLVNNESDDLDNLFLVDLIIDKISNFLFVNKLEKSILEIEKEKNSLESSRKTKYSIVLDHLVNTDRNLYTIVSRKMLNYLLIKGITESEVIFERLGSRIDEFTDMTAETNRPTKRQVLEQIYHISEDIFLLAAKYLSEEFILSQIERWINEENGKIVTKTLNDPNASLFDVGESIRRYYKMIPDNVKENSPQLMGMIVSLVRRFFTEQLEFINIAKSIFEIRDFYNILPRIIFASESYGTLGGKSSGLLLAKKIIESELENYPLLKSVKIPNTWFIPTDGEINFIYFNNLEDIEEQKYKTIDEIRKEYPYTMQVLKNGQFPEEMINGLSRALDEIGEIPIVVRSSSMLEDRMGTAFAGKYKSLFLANQGPKPERLEELLDAIAEVYASVFSPEPISYRKEKGLLDFDEGMGIIIQEVVGTKAGKYFFPSFAGVGFSNNEFRWSPRIKQEDGLIRLVPGLGTRAVDRVGNDFPVLISPGQPNLRVNLSIKDMISYAPRFIDVINLESNTFETVEISALIKEVGSNYPLLNEIFSIVEPLNIKSPVGLGIDTRKDDIVVTFDNLIKRTTYIKQIASLLNVLKSYFHLPVDIEFACNGKDLYLLQCRQQSFFETSLTPSHIPADIPKEDILFSAHRHISNAKVPDIAYIVYVDPGSYYKSSHLKELEDVARAIGKLNQILPKKSFILMGPGRWGTRDDIRLGVKVAYSDINNTAMLVEIAQSKNGYTPELSFGTHFFQDLVESQIYYLPLYPEDKAVIFDSNFFDKSQNVLTRFLEEFSHINHILKVINVREIKSGKILRILMNSDEEKAIAFFAEGDVKKRKDHDIPDVNIAESQNWRFRMAEAFTKSINLSKYNISGIYLAGSVFNSAAMPDSDIDIFIHSNCSQNLREEFLIWAEGWNSALSSINFNRTGYKVEKILDVTIVNDIEMESNQFFKDIMNPVLKKSKKLA